MFWERGYKQTKRQRLRTGQNSCQYRHMIFSTTCFLFWTKSQRSGVDRHNVSLCKVYLKKKTKTRFYGVSNSSNNYSCNTKREKKETRQEKTEQS